MPRQFAQDEMLDPRGRLRSAVAPVVEVRSGQIAQLPADPSVRSADSVELDL